MLKYLRGEIYRVLHKKSFYSYFACFAFGYCCFAIIRSGAADETIMLSDALNLFDLLPAIVGGYLFAALYTDDLQSRNLSTVISFGLGKAKIVLAKLLLMFLFAGLILGLLPLLMAGIYALLGLTPSAATLGMVYACSVRALLVIVAFSALAAIVVYGLQRATFGMVAYLLLALGVVGQLLGMLLSWDMVASVFPGLSDHLMFALTGRILAGLFDGGVALIPVIEYAVYLVVAWSLSLLAFYKKEVEF